MRTPWRSFPVFATNVTFPRPLMRWPRATISSRRSTRAINPTSTRAQAECACRPGPGCSISAVAQVVPRGRSRRHTRTRTSSRWMGHARCSRPHDESRCPRGSTSSTATRWIRRRPLASRLTLTGSSWPTGSATSPIPIDACQVPLVSSFIQLNSYLRQRGDYFKRREVDFLLSRLIGRGGLRSEWSERCA